MSGKVFLDTNVLVYACDSHSPVKQGKAQELLMYCTEQERGVLSTQVLSEFFCVVTGRIPKPIEADKAQSLVNDFSIMETVEVDVPMINRAIEAHKQYKLSFWDGLIVSAAERAGCREILTEDLNAGQEYFGVKAVNPFI